jgi:hypothetical protein
MLLLVGALAWLVGNLLFTFGAAADAVVPWWFALLGLTVAAERLEMTRLARHRPGASQALGFVLMLLIAGAAVSGFRPVAGSVVFGASLLGLAAWLFTFDIARRTIAARGLPRYMAVCLLLGYAWLAVSGAAWVGTALGWPLRDAALHAFALGFLFSMILGHAPVVLPAIARVKVLFGWALYVPLALLHGTLAVRLAVGSSDAAARAAGAAGNALSILLFAATLAGAAVAWRLRSTNANASIARRQ